MKKNPAKSAARKFLVKKPVLPAKPLKPVMPAIKPTLAEELTLHTATARYNTIATPERLLETLDKLPDDVDLKDVHIVVSCTYISNYQAAYRIFVKREKKNPVYETAKAKYDEELKVYEDKLAAREKEAADPTFAGRERLWEDLSALSKIQAKKTKKTAKDLEQITKLKKSLDELCKQLGIDAKVGDLELA